MSAHLIASNSHATGNFRSRLQTELAVRCGRNARYSLRAFANFLGTDHATLSQLLRGKRALTVSSIRRLGARIGLTPGEIERYVAQLQSSPDENATTQEVHKLAGDAARVFADWHAFAILELMRLTEFRPDVRWIARVLGVAPDEINIALQHLIRLGFLQMAAADRWVDLTGGAVLREDQFTLLALERLATRSREVQLASARNAPNASRVHGTMTLAVDETELARLMALAEKFLAEARVGSAVKTGDRLYHLEVHCFPLSTSPSTHTKQEP